MKIRKPIAANCRLCHRPFTRGYRTEVSRYIMNPNKVKDAGIAGMGMKIRRHWRKYHPMEYGR